MPNRSYVGIDVAKARLDIAVRPTGEQWVSATDSASLDELVRRLQALRSELIVLEATGGREGPAVAALAAAGLPVAVVNPRQVRDFARAVGHLAKTDALAAQVLAHCAQAIHPTPRLLPDVHAQELAALRARRRQLIQLLTAERQRVDTALPAVQTQIQRHLAWWEAELADLDRTLAERVQASPVWREREQLLRSVAGIGPTTALPLLAELPALGQLGQQGYCCPGRSRSALLRERHVAGAAYCLGRARSGPHRPLHGSARGCALQPHHCCLLYPIVRRRKAQESGADRLYAQTAHHSQCPGTPAISLVCSECPLTVKTIAFLARVVLQVCSSCASIETQAQG